MLTPPKWRPWMSAVFAAALVQAWLALRAERAYAALPRLGESAPALVLPPFVSIIVPARNEELNLRRLLPSLRALDYPRFELLVVDDGSEDATAGVAESLGARVLPAGPLPDGWVGKSHACWAGANHSTGEWLLFTDADTWHAPDSLGRALAEAQQRRLDAVSLLTDQECHSFWEALLLPFAYQHYFAGVRPRALANPRSHAVLLNGQYLLVRREAYFASDGHEAVRGSLVEDAALGALFKQRGVRFATLHAEGEVRVRMYTGLSGIWEGFAKNSARFLAVDPAGGALTILSTILSSTGVPLMVEGAAQHGGRTFAAGLGSYGLAVVAFARWQRRFNAPVRLAPLQPLAGGVFQAIGVLSAVRALTGSGARWKGRVYRL